MLLSIFFCLLLLSFLFCLWQVRKRPGFTSMTITILCAALFVGGCWKRQSLNRLLHTKNAKSYTPSCAINSRRLSLKKDAYPLHREQGKLLSDITLVKNNKKRDKYVHNGILVSLPKQGFTTQKMNYGSPFVHTKMNERLQELKRRFEQKQKENGLHNIQFVITSAYRTTSDQERLRKINPSATNGDSSHSYGASVDIARLSGKGCAQATPLFQEVLQEMQDEKTIYLCPESRTMHITLRHKG